MGSSSTHLLILPLNPPSFLPNSSQNPKFSSHFRCSFSSRTSKSDTFRPTRFDDFGFGKSKKRSNWWSDDDDDEEDDDDDENLGFWGDSNAMNSIFKVLRTFGWMVPALLVPILMGKEENSWIMALVLPLGQTALSLVMDKLWGDPSSKMGSRPKPRSRSRPRPRVRPQTRSRTRPERNPSRGGTRSMRGGYQSWEASDSTSSSATKGAKGGSGFGGWDE